MVRRAVVSGGASTAADEFCRFYWYPLYALARSIGASPEDAADQVQMLLAELFSRDHLIRADPDKGRLRGWLATLLKRRLQSHYRVGRALKRGGTVLHVSLDATGAGEMRHLWPVESMDPDTLYRRNLATALLDETIDALGLQYAKRGRTQLYQELLPALESKLPEERYSDVAQRLGMGEGAVRVAAFRLRDRFVRLLRQKCSLLLAVPEGPQLDQEMRDVFQ